jgi:hypothetical protein
MHMYGKQAMLITNMVYYLKLTVVDWYLSNCSQGEVMVYQLTPEHHHHVPLLLGDVRIWEQPVGYVTCSR